jgi:hypothetical protein
MRTKASLLTVISALVFLSAPPALAQRAESYGGDTPAAPGAPAQPTSVFKTVDGVVVKADAGEKALYLTEAGTDKKVKVILDESTKVRIDKQKGGLELVPSLKEGAEIRVVVNTETGVAVSVKNRKKSS